MAGISLVGSNEGKITSVGAKIIGSAVSGTSVETSASFVGVKVVELNSFTISKGATQLNFKNIS